MVSLLVIIVILLALSGVGSLTQATLGVGLICLGAVVGILARIAQADRHESEARRVGRQSHSAG